MNIEELKKEWNKLEDNLYFLEKFKLPLTIGNLKLIKFVNYLSNEYPTKGLLDISYTYKYKSNLITIYFYCKKNMLITKPELKNSFYNLIEDFKKFKFSDKKIYPFDNIEETVGINGKIYSSIFNAKSFSLIKDNPRSAFLMLAEERIYLWGYKNYYIKIRYTKNPVDTDDEFNSFFNFIDHFIET